MLLNIILEDSTKDYDAMYMQVAEKIHDTLVGNKDYVDSNILLNMDNKPVKKKDSNVIDHMCAECTVYISGNDVTDKELIRQKAKEAIDIFVDSLDK